MNKFITADVLHFLKKKRSNLIDLGITSPPYNKKEKNNGGLVSNVVYDEFRDNMLEEEYQLWQIKVLNELYRVIKPGGSFFYNHRIRYLNGEAIHPLKWLLKTKWRFRQEIIWNRTIAGNLRGWRFWPIEERIYWLYKPLYKGDKGKELISRHALLTSIWEIRPETKIKNHPAPFPIEIPTRIIYSILDKEEKKLIIDPFGGVGTTALAAHLLNHRFISVDISKEYNRLARKRLKENYTNFNIIKSEIEKHKVKLTYQERKKRYENKNIEDFNRIFSPEE